METRNYTYYRPDEDDKIIVPKDRESNGCFTVMFIALIAIILLILIAISSCSSSSYIQEDNIYITKQYVGNYVRMELHNGYSSVLTTNRVILVEGYPRIPDSVWCYVRSEPSVHDLHPDIKKKLTKKYFYWYGSEKEFKVINK
jgi:hypothetical protein